jgi:purine-binding chemotaxis protein CheW
MNRVDDAGLTQWLAEVRSEYWDHLGQTQEQGEAPGHPCVVFELAGKRFLVDARLCKGVVRRPRTTRLPGVPAHVLGVAGIRGEVVSSTDPALLLRMPGERPGGSGYFLVLASGRVKAALWVDRVVDVVALDEKDFLPLETPWSGAPKGLLTGQWSAGDDSVLVLDGPRYLELSAVGPPEG